MGALQNILTEMRPHSNTVTQQHSNSNSNILTGMRPPGQKMQPANQFWRQQQRGRNRKWENMQLTQVAQSEYTHIYLTRTHTYILLVHTHIFDAKKSSDKLEGAKIKVTHSFHKKC